MILIPAIDIKGGKVVRLFQGKFSDVSEYGDDPLAMALKWQSMGAKWVHVVDLDGAKTGVMANKDVIIRIAKTLKVPIEVGGGIRDEAAVEGLLKAGIGRVILGTSAIERRDFLRGMIAKHGEKICVSLDCANGYVASRGWVATTQLKAVDVAKELETDGLSWMVYTDIAKDGTLAGPNFEQLQTMSDAVNRIRLIASGGVSNLEDVRRLAAMPKVAAAITGKAIYEGVLDFQSALELC